MTSAPGIVRAGVIVLVLGLAGACLFGLWHVVVGGIVNGNPRAGSFGLVLAAASGLPLGLLARALRRSRDG